MKIYSIEVETDLGRRVYSIEVETDLGRRVVKLAAPLDMPLDIEPQGDMAPAFRSLTELLWGVLCEVASQGAALSPSRAEA
jgi:hypothetical protein